MHVESISLLLPFFSNLPPFLPSSLFLPRIAYVSYSFYVPPRAPGQPSPLREGKETEEKASHPDNEDPSYPVQIFSSAAVCTGNRLEIRSLHGGHIYIYTRVFVRGNLERASVLVDSASSIIPARLDNEFMRDHPSENFIPSEMQTQNSRR